MATGMARGAHARGKQIAFGDGQRLRWGPWCKEIFRDNPNIATHVHERVEWVPWYKGNRCYAKHDTVRRRWIWNHQFKATPGEFFFSEAERALAVARPDAVFIEPNLPWNKSVAPNKDWGGMNGKYQAVTDMLLKAGVRVFQTNYGKIRLTGAETIRVADYRQAAAALSGFKVAIVAEGGMMHAAAAGGVTAVVPFGGWSAPQVSGYDFHINLTGGATEACGKLDPCQHCRQALDSISVEEVFEAAYEVLQRCH